MTEAIWSCPAANKTLFAAATEFAQAFWPEPREVERIAVDVTAHFAAEFVVTGGGVYRIAANARNDRLFVTHAAQPSAA